MRCFTFRNTVIKRTGHYTNTQAGDVKPPVVCRFALGKCVRRQDEREVLPRENVLEVPYGW